MKKEETPSTLRKRTSKHWLTLD
jgi:predicted transcriptional regulator